MLKRTSVIIPIVIFLFCLSWLVGQTAQACVCYCTNGSRTLPDPPGYTECNASCSNQQCPPGSGVACQVDLTQGDCTPSIPGGGTTPGGGSGDQADTYEKDGVVFPKDPLELKSGPNDWITNAINVALGLIGAGAFILMLYGGAIIMFARGDSKKVADGRKIIVYAVIGIVVIMLSYAMINLVFAVIGEAVGGTKL